MDNRFNKRLNEYCISLFHDNNEISIIAYNLNLLDNIKYEMNISYDELIAISAFFNEFNNINQIYHYCLSLHLFLSHFPFDWIYSSIGVILMHPSPAPADQSRGFWNVLPIHAAHPVPIRLCCAHVVTYLTGESKRGFLSYSIIR